jgi:hypothetical protein
MEAIMRQRIIVGVSATVLIATLSVVAVRALQSRHPAAAQPDINGEARQQSQEKTMKIVPATADGPGGGFFIGTGDGGNGYYTK